MLARCEDPSLSEDAEIEAGAYSSTSVRHLRILAAKFNSEIPKTRPFAEAPDQCTALGFVAWIAAIRDVGRSLATGTACELCAYVLPLGTSDQATAQIAEDLCCFDANSTDDDIASLLGIDHNVPLPSPEQILQSWANVYMPEGDLILVWAQVILQGRTVVRYLTQRESDR